ncbi:MAG: GAF domain-containing protein [Dehalococcoidia bacterium]|nr:GAF domain-containing protein [Dehalococcoidia bacterium]
MTGDPEHPPPRLILALGFSELAARTEGVLGRTGAAFEFRQAASEAEVERLLATERWDAVIAAEGLPGIDPIRLSSLITQNGTDVPLVVISPEPTEARLAQLLAAGVDDIVSLGNLTRLVVVLNREFRSAAERRRLRAAETALKESEARFRLLALNAQDIIFRYRYLPDPAWEFISASVSSISGYDPEVFYRDPDITERFVHPDDLPWVRVLLRSGDAPSALLYRWIRRDGRTIWMEQRCSYLRDASGSAVALEGVIRDVTEREEQERDRRERSARVAALDEVSRSLAAASLDLRVILDILARHTAELIGDSCVIRLLSADGRRLEPAAFHHADPLELPKMREALEQIPLPADTGVHGEVMRSGEAILLTKGLPDAFRSSFIPELSAYLEGMDVQSLALVSIRSDGQPVGLLVVGRHFGKPSYSEEDRIFLQELADRAGLALANAKLFDNVEKQLQRVEGLRNVGLAIAGSLDIHLTLDVILAEVVNLLQADAADVLLLDKTTQYLVPTASRGFHGGRNQNTRVHLGEGLSGRVAAERRVLVVANLPSREDHPRPETFRREGFLSYTAAPLIAKGQVLGVLETFHRRHFEPTPEWLDSCRRCPTRPPSAWTTPCCSRTCSVPTET